MQVLNILLIAAFALTTLRDRRLGMLLFIPLVLVAPNAGLAGLDSVSYTHLDVYKRQR